MITRECGYHSPLCPVDVILILIFPRRTNDYTIIGTLPLARGEDEGRTLVHTALLSSFPGSRHLMRYVVALRPAET